MDSVSLAIAGYHAIWALQYNHVQAISVLP